MSESINKQVVRIAVKNIELEAELSIPEKATGLVIFAHGSGSSRHSKRNKFVAEKLNEQSSATLLVDLLTAEEDINYETRFDIGLLTDRLVAITEWAKSDKRTKKLQIGYFGASTGAAAAILAAAKVSDSIRAIVSRGGRVDLAYEKIELLKVPILLIVGQYDSGVLEANKVVLAKLTCKKDIAIVPNATHLFEEPGAIEKVAELAAGWFAENLV